MIEDQLYEIYQTMRFGHWGSMFLRISDGFIVDLLIQQGYTAPIDAIFIFIQLLFQTAVPLWFGALLFFQIHGFATGHCDEGVLWFREFFLFPSAPFERKSCGWEFHSSAVFSLNSVIWLGSYVLCKQCSAALGWKLTPRRASFLLCSMFSLFTAGCFIYMALQAKVTVRDAEMFLRDRDLGSFLYFLGVGLAESMFDPDLSAPPLQGQLAWTARIKKHASYLASILSKDWLGDSAAVLGFLVMFLSLRLLGEKDRELDATHLGRALISIVLFAAASGFLVVLFALGAPRLFLKLKDFWLFKQTGRVPQVLFLVSKLCIIKNIEVYQGITFGPYTRTVSTIATLALMAEAIMLTQAAVFLLHTLLESIDYKLRGLWNQSRAKKTIKMLENNSETHFR